MGTGAVVGPYRDYGRYMGTTVHLYILYICNPYYAGGKYIGTSVLSSWPVPSLVSTSFLLPPSSVLLPPTSSHINYRHCSIFLAATDHPLWLACSRPAAPARTDCTWAIYKNDLKGLFQGLPQSPVQLLPLARPPSSNDLPSRVRGAGS